MLGRGVDRALEAMRPEEPWGDLLPTLLAADLRLANLECALTRRARPWTRTFKAFHFRADPRRALDVLRAARVDAVSLANNHVLDFEEEGLFDTLRALDSARIAHAGAGGTLDTAMNAALLPGRVALISATDNEPDWEAGPRRPGVFYLPVSLEPEVLDAAALAIARARAAGAEFVVFANHWGPNMRERPTPLFQSFAHAVLDRGADLYWGHSAHVTQGVEIYRGKAILYDTGDFLDDYAVDPVLRNDWSFVFRVTVRGGALERIELFPVVLTYAHVRLASGVDREEMLERMRALSIEMGTSLERSGGHLVLDVESHGLSHETAQTAGRGAPGAPDQP